MKLSFKIMFTVVLLIFFSSLQYAQTRTGTLIGNVMDEEGEPLPGVEVIISSPNLIAPSLSSSTNERGFFRFPYVPPGVYTIRTVLPGFSTHVTENVNVSLGLTTDINIEMSAERLSEEITVISQEPIMSKENTKLSTNISADEIIQLPVNRSLYTVISFAPGMLGTNAMGGGSRENTFAVDGVSVTDPGSGSGLGAVQSMDAYEEVQIELGGHAAEHGNASGAIINVVTRSGGNEFHGGASLYFKNDSLQSTNFEGTGLSASSNETIYDYNVNFSLG